MILGFDPIDLSGLLAALRMQVELSGLHLAPDVDVFGDERGRSAVDEAVASVASYVEDNIEQESQIRRALCWLINQPDQVLEDVFHRGRVAFDNPDPVQHRRYYIAIWERTFASAVIQDAYPENTYELLGLD